VAGPIERAKNLLPQIGSPRRASWTDLGSGAYLILWGLFKKVVIADNVATFADTSFAHPVQSGVFALLGVLAFTVQIYADFSAYSDIARGSARCLGFDLMLNFNLPYFCTSVADFYRRWHISLSTWLRDYLYIPLGGNRVSTPRLYTNLMLTMLLGGLWHGASWTFVMWGAFQGILLCAHRLMLPAIDRVKPDPDGPYGAPWHVASLIFFVPFTLMGRLLFRAQSPQQVWDFTVAPFTRFPGPIPGWVNFELLAGLGTATAFLFGFQLLQYRTGDLNVVYQFPTPLRGVFYAGLVLAIVVFGAMHGEAFVYFQF
jgi:D-alanyl-lipoteichoic acid acyltransferase DltB (MBOAT superfamily)